MGPVARLHLALARGSRYLSPPFTMAPPNDKPSAHRPLLRRNHAKRALVNVGGPVETAGDEALAQRLAACLTAEPGERDATLTHPFHAYPARLHPDVARSLLDALCPAPTAVLDPFCGSGTVLIEALASGHRPVGRDLSPFAVELAALKTRLTTSNERKAMVNAARALSARAADVARSRVELPVPDGEARWFHPHTLREVAALTREVGRAEAWVRPALRMLLSSVLVKVSLQSSDSDVHLAHKDVAPGAALNLFAYKARELAPCLAALAAAVPRGTAPVDLAVDDAAQLTTVPAGSVGAIVTSPPYANTYDYVSHHARRYAWLGLDASRMAEGEIGAARWFAQPEVGAQRFARELADLCAAFARVMAPGALAAVVIADGAAGNAPLRADEAIAAAAASAGLQVVARASQERRAYDRESVRAFAQQPKREHVLALGRT
jgi:hypothetical protein